MGSIYKNGIAYTSGGGGGASDSGWLELAGTAAINPDYKFYYRKVGAIVYVQAAFKWASNIRGAVQSTAFTLPEGFRPKIPVNFTLKNLSNNVYTDITTGMTAYIAEDGTCAIKYQYTMSSSQIYVIDTAFVSA